MTKGAFTSSEGQGAHPRQPSQSDAAARTEATLPDPGSKGACLDRERIRHELTLPVQSQFIREDVRSLLTEVDRLREWVAATVLMVELNALDAAGIEGIRRTGKDILGR